MGAIQSMPSGTNQAMVANKSHYWKQYADVHNSAFEGKKKFLLLDKDGAIVNRSDDPKELVLLNSKSLSNAGTVRHEDFLTIQQEIQEVRRRSLNGITDLMSAGLSYTVSIEEQLVGYENINEFQEARQEMNPNAYQNNDTQFVLSVVPNPVTHQSWSIAFRQGGFDYKRSMALTESVRQVSEKLEDTLFNGNAAIGVNYGGSVQTIYGYTTHPSRGTGTISDWTNTTNVEKIVPETIEQIGQMWSTQGGVSNGRVTMYVANDIWNVFQKDYKAEVRGSIMDRLKEIAQIMDVKPAEKLASGEVVLVEMERRTIQLPSASDIITVPHTKTAPFEDAVFTTYAAMTPQIKVDSKGNTGIRHLTTA